MTARANKTPSLLRPSEGASFYEIDISKNRVYLLPEAMTGLDQQHLLESANIDFE